MFKSLKLYSGLNVDLERLFRDLVDFGYKRQDAVLVEGDFSRRGGLIDIFPNSFELPIRIELDNDLIASIETFNPSSGESLWGHRMVIVLPIRKSGTLKTTPITEDFQIGRAHV